MIKINQSIIQAKFEIIGILRLGLRYFPENTSSAVLFSNMVFINFWILKIIAGTILGEISILCFGAL
jgi:hypothetical protein